MQSELSPELIEKIEKTASGPLRAASLDWHGQKLWVKRAVPDKRKIWHRCQGAVAVAFPFAILRPTTSSGGAEGLSREAARIEKFSAAGFTVPQVLAITQRWLLIGDLGRELEHRLKHDPAVTNGALATEITAAAALIAEAHKAGLAHGRASLRDIVRTPAGALGFIDFEEEIEQLPLPTVQARDLWLFICSAVRFESRVPGIGRQALLAYLAVNNDPAMQGELKKLLGLLRPWAALLRPLERHLRSDILHGYKATETLRTALG